MLKKLLILASIHTSFAAAPTQSSLLNELVVYLNGIRMLEAEFYQYHDNQKPLHGHMKMLRPLGNTKSNEYGFLKLSYDPPYPYLFLVRDGALVQYALETREKSAYDMSSTPLGLILKNKIDLSKKSGVKVIDLKDTKDEIILSVTHVDNENMTLILEFAKKPFLILKGWVVIDPQGNHTKVALDYLPKKDKPSNIQINSGKLSAKDFQIP